MLRCLVAFWCALLASGAAAADGHPTDHWAFRPVPAVVPPAVRNEGWVRSTVDRFILADLEARGLEPAPEASREVLIRRLSFDLTGLPPTPAEVEAFVSDGSVEAWERLIDRLLASPHYGERWARHWLDLARYAESDGFEHDAVRPGSWRYRDYVIDSFNADKPYDRFLQEQMAGDERWPEDPAALVATGFNLLGPDMVDSADPVQRRLNTLNDMTDTLGAAVMGLTFGCARCHDHKSEPFTQRDYFGLQAFFAPAEFKREFAVATGAQKAAQALAMGEYDAATRELRARVEAIERPARERVREEKLARLSEDARQAHRTPKERRTKEQEGTVQETAGQVAVSMAEMVQALGIPERGSREGLLAELNRIPKPTPLPTAMVLQNGTGPVPQTFVLARGDYNAPREEVFPCFPAVFGGAGAGSVPVPAGAAGRRAALAAWLTHPDHPLTARVMVNRIWQHHFGRGLVSTPGDFGIQGARPTHPRLLDWLAGEFVRGGWSVKRMHRLILGSAAWRQSTAGSPETHRADPENRWLARQNRVRLEGEAVRDSLLFISGRLNPAIRGPSVFPPLPSGLAATARHWVSGTNTTEHHRRSVYVFARRNFRFPLLEVFDAPDPNLTCPERGRSTTAPQALALLNSDEVLAASAATARRVRAEAVGVENRIDLAVRLILGRRATPAEREMARSFLEAGSDDAELCRALFNLNAFVYVD